MSALTVKQRAFLVEYLKRGNAAKAAEIAGYANCSVAGVRLRRNKKIADAISEFFRDGEMQASEVVFRLSEQARGLQTNYLSGDGKVDLQALLDDGLGHLVKSVRQTKHGMVVNFYDSQSALVQLGRFHGLFTDKIDHTVEIRPIEYIEVEPV